MDYQLTQTGAEVQGILNQVPEVVAVGGLNSIDAVGNYYVTDGDGKARGYLICSQAGPAGSPFYLQTYLHDGAIYSRSGNALPLTGEWVNPLQSKVDKETGKGLSTNDFTTALKDKLEGMADVKEVDVSEIDGFIDNDDEGLYFVSGNTSTPFFMQMYRDGATAYQWLVEPHSGKILIRTYNTQAVSPAWSELADAYADKQDTISDLSTIRSGAAAGATAVQPATMDSALAEKQDTLTFDNTPTANSNNPVKSGGVKTAIDAKQDTISTVNVTVDNNTGTPSGSASVSGSTLSISFQNLKGATGAQGPQGIQGVQGVQGPKGDTGVTGDASSLAIIHGIDKTTSYGTTDVCGADAAQALLNEIEGGFYY